MTIHQSSRLIAVSITTALVVAACGDADFEMPSASGNGDQQAATETKEIFSAGEMQRPSVQSLSDCPAFPSPSDPPPLHETLYSTGSGDDLVFIRKAPGSMGEYGWHHVEINGQVFVFTTSELNSVRFDLGNGDDVLYVDPNVDVDIHAIGGRGNDHLYGGAGNDHLNGLNGHDHIHGGGGNDFLVGSLGNDEIHGGSGADLILGQSGKNRIWGNAGKDWIMGSTGDDEIDGGKGNDVIIGAHGNDTLRGGRGHDKLNGSLGDDKVHGDAGNDILCGGTGRDTLTGGSGNDQYFLY